METLPVLAARLIDLFSPLDLAALTVFALCSLGMTLAIERDNAANPSVGRLMEGYRRAWMQTFARREGRIFDAALLATLRGGAAFFASTCLIAIGGMAALLGQTDQIMGLAQNFGAGAGEGSAPVWEAKLILILLLLVNAFLKFVWSHRLFGYCAVLMGALPEGADEASLTQGAERASRLQTSAARSFNRGLRAIYFTLAALAWFLGPVPLILTSLATAAMLWRREFRSRSRRALMSEAGSSLPPE